MPRTNGKINKDTTLGEIVIKYPESADIIEIRPLWNYHPEFARPSGSGRISRMPKIDNSYSEFNALDYATLHPELSIFVHIHDIWAALHRLLCCSMGNSGAGSNGSWNKW